MINNNPVGYFDSGVGGLSILKEIQKLLPLESSVFLADQKNIPYGKKNKQELNKITEKITTFLITQKIKLLVVACNTATCYSIDHLRRQFKIPIIGVVPAIKTAASISKKSKISILSTPATTKSNYLKKLIETHAGSTEVKKIACTGLEEAVETLDKNKIDKLLNLYAKNIIDFGSDVAVLGCTHYPIIKNSFQKKLGPTIKLVDSGAAIAKRVEHILKTEGLLANKKTKDLYFTTANEEIFSKVTSAILNSKITAQKAKL